MARILCAADILDALTDRAATSIEKAFEVMNSMVPKPRDPRREIARKRVAGKGG